MRKYIITLAALSLCACSAHTAQTPQTPQTSDTTTVSVFRAPATEQAPVGPVTIELAANGSSSTTTIQVMPCHDDLDCLQKVTGICPNGYDGGQKLVAENNRRVGIAFHCISDSEKAERAETEAKEKAWRTAREQEWQKQQADEAAAKKKAATKKK